MPLVPGAPHIALRCPVSKEPGAFPRKSVSLRREAPLLPSCGGVAVTLSGSRGIASHFPRFFPIFFPDMTGNDGFFPQKSPARGDSGIQPPGVPGRDAPAFPHGVDGPLTPPTGFGSYFGLTGGLVATFLWRPNPRLAILPPRQAGLMRIAPCVPRKRGRKQRQNSPHKILPPLRGSGGR